MKNHNWIFALALAMNATIVRADNVISVTAKKYEFIPAEITVKSGVPVVLQFQSADRKHGVSIPSLNLRTDINPGQPAEIRFTPDKPGTYDFICDVFCGSGHESMAGKLIVTK